MLSAGGCLHKILSKIALGMSRGEEVLGKGGVRVLFGRTDSHEGGSGTRMSVNCMQMSQHSTVCSYSHRLPTLHMPSHTSAHSHFIIFKKLPCTDRKIGAGGDDNQLIILTWPNILQTSCLGFFGKIGETAHQQKNTKQ